ncbi:hypothetical protein BKA69DRAFT_1067035 [Paraphysoderma sedebokerense]|nr:hypothetical protein BKA69DRAFT_1067035 [Paraphysoderma sedebokerense]
MNIFRKKSSASVSPPIAPPAEGFMAKNQPSPLQISDDPPSYNDSLHDLSTFTFQPLPLPPRSSKRSHTYTVPASYIVNLTPRHTHSCPYDDLEKKINEAALDVEVAKSSVDSLSDTLNRIKDNPQVDALVLLQDEGQIQAKLRSMNGYGVSEYDYGMKDGADSVKDRRNITFGELKRQKYMAEQELIRKERIKAFEDRERRRMMEEKKEKNDRLVHNLGVAFSPGGGVSPDYYF